MSRTAVQTAVVGFGAVDASATPLGFWRAPADITIIGIHLITSTAVAAHATDIFTTAVTNLGLAGAGTDVIATQTVDSDVTGYSAITALVPWAVTLSATLAYLEMAVGEVLQIEPTEGGTATSGDLADAFYVITYREGCGQGYS